MVFYITLIRATVIQHARNSFCEWNRTRPFGPVAIQSTEISVEWIAPAASFFHTSRGINLQVHFFSALRTWRVSCPLAENGNRFTSRLAIITNWYKILRNSWRISKVLKTNEEEDSWLYSCFIGLSEDLERNTKRVNSRGKNNK